ncbi:CAP domain-containing protein [Kutzneria albida]|uniref:SCP domain-containing protein n=1 Tax=Kutzneria albida DSM 43870 TaxID=1449976 RepID=W5WIY8_9PSEU|nr:CAP domain-containing protein [Kutzneria albida]AHI00696.1 hypothetical protein KALB_7338 [Kutzneria albida DSM 43870]
MLVGLTLGAVGTAVASLAVGPTALASVLLGGVAAPAPSTGQQVGVAMGAPSTATTDRPTERPTNGGPSPSASTPTATTPPTATSTTTAAPTTTTTTQPVSTTVRAPSTKATASGSARVLELVNQARANAGCKALREDSRLDTAAQNHSSDMSDHDYFSHTSQDGRTFADRERQAGYPSPGGENIAQGYRTADAVMDGWMHSEGHRRNILDCGYASIGIGMDSDGFYWTQDFGR